MDGIHLSILKLLGGRENKEKYFCARLRVHWPKVAGDDIAGKSVPVKLRGKTLFLNVEGSSWAHHLLTRKNELICRINRELDDIIVDDIKFFNNSKKDACLK